MAAFDLTLAIADFLADESRSSLKLPHMTTGQRKNAKLLVDKYAEIRCESFGFGAERQLHLFKIDAEVAPQNERAHSPDSSTQASTDASDVSYSRSASPQPFDQDREEESLRAISFINVRNTFIHLETASVDERSVQSMPHGMFGRCMLAEISHKGCVDKQIEKRQSNVGIEAIAAETTFGAGTLVLVDGLVRAPAFNGLTAVVEAWDETSERYRILIGSSGVSQKAMVKKENLKLVSQCP
jgi:hypothetical protein